MSLCRNNCKYGNCGKVFLTLVDLITHIELEHLDFSQQKLDELEEEKPEYIHMSYVLRYSHPDDPLPYPLPEPKPAFDNKCGTMSPYKIHKYNPDYMDKPMVSNNNNNNISNNNNDLKLNLEEVSPEVKAFLHQNRKLYTCDDSHKKPFACNLPGCHKRYKNVNGIKYHYKNYHKFRSTPAFKKSVLKYKTPPLQRRSPIYESSCSSSLLLPRASTLSSTLSRYEENNESEYLFKLSSVMDCNQVHNIGSFTNGFDLDDLRFSSSFSNEF